MGERVVFIFEAAGFFVEVQMRRKCYQREKKSME